MQTRELTSEQSGFKVGDILCGQTHWYRTVTYWYQIVRLTPKRVVLKQLPVSYATEYLSNTPGSECMPVIDGEVDPRCPYYFAGSLDKDYVECQGKIMQFKDDWMDDWGKPDVSIIGFSDGPLLSLWNGMPGWVNCD